MEKGYNFYMNHKDFPQMVKDKVITNNSDYVMMMHTGGEMQWPFSSTVFLPPPYNKKKKKMPPASPSGPAQEEENDNIYSVSAPSLWHSSSVPPLHHNSNPTSLTLLYSGSLHVYHGVSPSTVEAIKSIASREHSPMTVGTKQTSLAEDIKRQPSNAEERTSAKFIAGALTMARKATLARFLQKRKYRLTSAKPYQVTSEKMLYRPTPQSPTTSFFNLLMLQEEGTGSSSSYC